MKEDNDTKEKDLAALKLEHKRLTLQHILLLSDHEMLKIKYSDTSENAPNSNAHYQRQIDDWQSKFNARDADVNKLLTRQVENLKNVIVTQGLTMPLPEPVGAPAPAPVQAPVPASSNAPEEFPTPGPGWQFGGAARAANRPTWGNMPPPEPIMDNGWGNSPSPAPQYSSDDYSDSSVEPQYNSKGKPFGRGNNNNKSKGKGNKYFTQPSNVTLAMIMHATYDKNRGIMMESPLLKLGLRLHIFVFTCVIFRLELPKHYLYL